MRLKPLLFSILFISLCGISSAQVRYRLKQGDTVEQSFLTTENANNFILGLNTSRSTAKINTSLLALDPRYPTVGITQQPAQNPMLMPQLGSVLQLVASENITINRVNGGSPGQVVYVTNISPTSVIRFTSGSGIYVRGQATIVLGYNQSCTLLKVNSTDYSIW